MNYTQKENKSVEARDSFEAAQPNEQLQTQ